MEISKQIKISVLVATCNRPEMLKVCIQGLFAQKTEILYEIIVLDQSDPEKRMVLQPGKRTVRNILCNFKNKSRALNLGVKHASADYIAVIDDDCIADTNWVDLIYQALQKEGSDFIITGRVVAGNNEKEAIRSRLHDVLDRRTVFKKNKITPIFKLSGCNFGFHKTAYTEVGLFNENLGPGSSFKSSDDNEWAYRALNLGFKIIYVPEAKVIHRSWRNTREDINLMKDYGYAAGAFFKLIFKTSKLDFLHHGVQLWWWLLKTILFSFDIHEIVPHTYYGLFFCKGFLLYHCRPDRFFDYIFILSPGKYVGGAERYVQNLARELQKYGISKIIIAVSHNREFYSECKKNFHAIYLGDTLKKASAGLSGFLKNNKIATAVSNGYHSSYLVFIARLRNMFRSNGCKFIDIKHGWITTNFSERFKTILDRLAAIFYDFVILVNPSMKRSLWFIGEKKLVFIPSGVSVENDFISRQPRANPLKILLIGRLAEEKRFGLVFEALSYIPKNLWQLTVVGDGPKSDILHRLAVQNNIHDRIDFAGYQENIVSFYQNADLLVILSINEGCPLVALEAMTHGVLVLSTNVGYMPALLNEGRGFLVDVNIAPLELSRKIKEIAVLDDEIKNKCINNARRFVYENHNLGRNVEIFKNLVLNQ